MSKERLFLRWASIVACALALVIGAGILGCSSKQQKALEEAKKQAAATGQPQQVVTVDKDGNTITTVVQPPAQGQKEPTVVTTTTPLPAGQPKPSASGPVVSAVPQPAAQPEQAPGQAPAPAPVEVSIPSGTDLEVRTDQSISVKTSHAGDRFTGELVRPVTDSRGNLLVPRGTQVAGVVDASHERGRFKGESVLSLRLTSMRLNGAEYSLTTRDLSERKKGKGKRSAAMIGGGAGLGMLIGGLAGGGKGLLWGGMAGAGAGTAAAGLTGNRDLSIPAESVVHFRLAQDVALGRG